MMENMSVKSKRIIRNAIFIIIFLLLPGIRGYKNFQVHEYALFVALPIAYLIYDMIMEPTEERDRKDMNKKLGKILIQEIIRSIAFGWVIFTFLGLLNRGGVFSRSTFLITFSVIMGIQFTGFTITRLITGRDLMIRTAKDWSIFAAITNALLLIFVVVGVMLGQTDLLFKYGVWPYVVSVVLVGLLSWAGYWASARKHDNDQNPQ